MEELSEFIAVRTTKEIKAKYQATAEANNKVLSDWIRDTLDASVWDDETMVKILCHTCKGDGRVQETEWETNEDVWVVCPECGDTGYITVEKRKEAED